MRKTLLIVAVTRLILCACGTLSGNKFAGGPLMNGHQLSNIRYLSTIQADPFWLTRGKEDTALLYKPLEVNEDISRVDPEDAKNLKDEGPFWENRVRRSGNDFVLHQRDGKDGFEGNVMPNWPSRGRRSGAEPFLETRGQRHFTNDMQIPVCKYNIEDVIAYGEYRNRREEDSNPFWGNRGKRTESENPFWGNRGKKDEENSPLWVKQGGRDDENTPFWGNRGRRYDDNAPFWGNRGKRDDEDSPFWGNRGKKDVGTSPFWGNRGRRDTEDLSFSGNRAKRRDTQNPFWHNRGKKPDDSKPFWGNRGRNSELASLFLDKPNMIYGNKIHRNPFKLNNDDLYTPSGSEYIIIAPETETEGGSRFIRQTNISELLDNNTESGSQLPEKEAKNTNNIICNLINDRILKFSGEFNDIEKSSQLQPNISVNNENAKLGSVDLRSSLRSKKNVAMGNFDSKTLSRLQQIYCSS